MDLTVKEINGNTTRLTVDTNATVAELKQKISQEISVDPSQQKLSANIHQRINLNDDARSLGSYGLASGSSVALLRTPVPKPVSVNEEHQISTSGGHVIEPVNQLQDRQPERVPVDYSRPSFTGHELRSRTILPNYSYNTVQSSWSPVVQARIRYGGTTTDPFRTVRQRQSRTSRSFTRRR